MSVDRINRRVPRLALNQTEAAEALGVSVDHFERHIKPEIPVVLTGARRLYSTSALEEWLEGQQLAGGRRVA